MLMVLALSAAACGGNASEPASEAEASSEPVAETAEDTGDENPTSQNTTSQSNGDAASDEPTENAGPWPVPDLNGVYDLSASTLVPTTHHPFAVTTAGLALQMSQGDLTIDLAITAADKSLQAFAGSSEIFPSTPSGPAGRYYDTDLGEFVWDENTGQFSLEDDAGTLLFIGVLAENGDVLVPTELTGVLQQMYEPAGPAVAPPGDASATDSDTADLGEEADRETTDTDGYSMVEGFLQDILGLEGSELDTATQCVLDRFDSVGLSALDDETGSQLFIAANQCDLVSSDLYLTATGIDEDVDKCSQAAAADFFRGLDLRESEVIDSESMPSELRDALLACGYPAEDLE